MNCRCFSVAGGSSRGRISVITASNIWLILLEDSSDIGFLVNRYLAWSLGDADVEEFFS
jgi:hypothetical protein